MGRTACTAGARASADTGQGEEAEPAFTKDSHWPHERRNADLPHHVNLDLPGALRAEPQPLGQLHKRIAAAVPKPGEPVLKPGKAR